MRWGGFSDEPSCQIRAEVIDLPFIKQGPDYEAGQLLADAMARSQAHYFAQANVFNIDPTGEIAVSIRGTVHTLSSGRCDIGFVDPPFEHARISLRPFPPSRPFRPPILSCKNRC